MSGMTEESVVNDDTVTVDESTASGVWNALLAGNRRFQKRTDASENATAENETADHKNTQTRAQDARPKAIVLACADGRVTPDTIFDAQLGELYTVRTAGNIVGPDAIASLEFAVDRTDAKLLVVLGHEDCQALKYAAEGVEDIVKSGVPLDDVDEELESATNPILKFAGNSVWQARMAGLERAEDFEQVHIAHTIEALVTDSDVIRAALANDRLMIVGARYVLKTGAVEVLSF